jgi:hypothetical protein
LNKAFTKEECEKIINVAKNKGLTTGKTVGGGTTDPSRNSDISWLNPTDNFHWVYQRLTDIIVPLNKDFFKFDLYGINEGLQFTNYKAPSGKYGKHIDRNMNMAVRNYPYHFNLLIQMIMKVETFAYMMAIEPK